MVSFNMRFCHFNYRGDDIKFDNIKYIKILSLCLYKESSGLTY